MARAAEESCPDWIDEFLEDIGIGIDTGEVPAAYDVWGPTKGAEEEATDDPWVVHFYPSLSEVVGGPNDGTVVHPGLYVDLVSLQECLEEVEDMSLSSGQRFLESPYEGAMLELTGWYDGHPVSLRIFDKPPGDAPVESHIDYRKVLVRPQDQRRG